MTRHKANPLESKDWWWQRRNSSITGIDGVGGDDIKGQIFYRDGSGPQPRMASSCQAHLGGRQADSRKSCKAECWDIIWIYSTSLVVIVLAQLCPTLCDLPGSSVHGVLWQECWSGLPFPSPGDLPDPGIEPGCPTLQADSSPSEPPGKAI